MSSTASRAAGRRCGHDTPRPDSRNVVLFARPGPGCGERVPLLGRSQQRRRGPGRASSGWSRDGTSTDIDFFVDRDGSGDLFLDPGSGRHRRRVLRRERSGRGSDQHRLRRGPGLSHHDASRAHPGLGYVFEMDGGDGFLRYGARARDPRRARLPDSRLGVPDRSGNPELHAWRSRWRASSTHVPAAGVVSRRARRQLRAMPDPHCVLDGRSLTIDDVVRVARDPGLRVDARRRGPRARCSRAGAWSSARIAVRPDDLRDQYRLRQARQRPHRARPARSAPDQSDPQPRRGRGRAAAGRRSFARSCCFGPTCCSGRPAASGPSWWMRWSPCSTPASCRWCRSREASAPAATSRRSATSALALMGEGDVLAATGAAAAPRRRCAAPASRPYRFAPKEGLAFINGTQAQTALLALLVHDAQRPLADRDRRGGDEPGGAAGDAGAARPSDSRGPAAPGPDRGGGAHARAARATARSGSRTGRTIPGCRTPTACAARRRCSAPWPTRSGSPRTRATVELNASTDNPLVFREWRRDLRRQLPRPAGGPGARHPGDDAHHAAGHRRAAGGAAGQSRPLAGAAGVSHRGIPGSRPGS